MTLGDLLLDVVVRLDTELVPGDDQPAHTATGPGGQAANVAAWAAALGAEATFVGRVGSDPAGELVLHELAQRGVTHRGPVAGRTGVVVSIAAAGDRTMASDHGNAPELAPRDLQPTWFDCDVLHVSGYALAREPIASAAEAAAKHARAQNTTVSLDVSAWTLVDAAFRARVAALAPDLVFATEREQDALGLPGGRRRGRRHDRGRRRARRGILGRRARARNGDGGTLLRKARCDAVIRIAEEVREAAEVVALETTLVAHGFPPGEGVKVGLTSEAAVREAGAVPATIGVLDGEIVVGLSADELRRFGADARKLGPRDLAAAVAQRAVGATTVGGTLAVCRAVGIRVMATGGLGGVHRGWPTPPDVSADLQALASTEVVVVSSGVKSLLDVPATSELLETLGVPVLGYRTDDLPLFYAAHGGPAVSARVESEAEAAAIARAHWQIGGGGLLVGRPPDESLDDAEPLIERALAEADAQGVHGQAVTPFVLSYLHRESDGRTLAENRDLIVGNARLAGEIAVSLRGV